MSAAEVNIRGLDLKIDSAVQRTCEAYNSSSGSTRSVLYFLLLINVLSLIAVINTHRFNWTDQRIDALYWEIQALQKQRQYVKDTFELKKLDDRLTLTKNVREFNIRNKIDKYQNVYVPILGDAFDVNNMVLVSGIAFILLLVVLRFTLTREKNNLRLALESISERYYDGILEDELLLEARLIAGPRLEVVNQINRTRRKHHYNFLSMNEVFNLPMLEVSDNALQKTFLAKVVNKSLFYFPYFIYLIIFINDLTTIGKGLETSFWLTLVSTILGYICLWFISYLCKYCNIQKAIVHDLFLDFFSHDYKYYKSDEKLKKDKLIDRVLYPISPIIEIFSNRPFNIDGLESE